MALSREPNSTILAPPTQGWNSRDPISSMGPGYAVELENFFPNLGVVELRRGFQLHASGFTGTAGMTFLAEYNRSSGTSFLLASNGTSGDILWNATSAGVATQITGAGGVVHTFYANYRDRFFIKSDNSLTDVYEWTGSGGMTTAGAGAGFTGPSGDDKDLWKIFPYKNRLYFIQRAAASIWYSGVDAVSGALTEFSVQSVLAKGGQIYHIGSYTSGGYSSLDNLFVIISREGEILLYQGDNPGSATWSLVGQFFIAPPIGKRSFFYWGRDLIIITTEGLVSLNDVIGAGQKGDYTTLTDAISPSYKELAETVLATFSFFDFVEGIHYPKGPYIMINFIIASGQSVQLVMNTITRAWTKFTNQNIQAMAILDGNLYFAVPKTSGAPVVMKADVGYYDEDPNSVGNPMSRSILMRQAYNYFGNNRRKLIVGLRPTIRMTEGLTLTVGADMDFSDTADTFTVTDTTDTSYKQYQPLIDTSGEGKACSVRIDQSVTTKRMSLEATEVFWIEGTTL